MATIRDVAQLANVSPSTVSHTLNETAPISEETKQRVLQCVDQLGYVSRRKPRRGAKTRFIAVITDDIAAPFVPSMIKGIQHHACRNGYEIVVRQAPLNNMASVLDLNLKGLVGVIIATSLTPNLRGIDTGRLPTVLCHCRSENLPFMSVMPDDFRGGYTATLHLLENGWSPIVHIGGPLTWTAGRERKKGYLYALKQHGLSENEELIRHSDDWELSSGYKLILDILKRVRPPFGLFCANDLFAVGAIQALREQGFDVPGDVGVVGFDNREICEYVIPKLTSLQLPAYYMGEAAAGALLDMVTKEKRWQATTSIECPLIVRDSSIPRSLS
ncbi:MAG: LacI family DNA-binding transcriptional regulator [Firmicutes bacterium]|nr:LacI family DNA-binding transcriptional regulator [Bacillota bacterium]